MTDWRESMTLALARYQDEEPAVSTVESSHVLADVSVITHATVGWRDMPHGGKVPIREALAEPHSRWYCTCGSVSRRYPTPEHAERAFEHHLNEMERTER